MSFRHWSSVREPRGLGMTTALVDVAKRLNCVVVSPNETQARDLRRRFGVQAISVSQGAGERGIVRGHVWEPDAVRVALGSAEERKHQLEQELLLSKTQRQDLLAALESVCGALASDHGDTVGRALNIANVAIDKARCPR